MSRSGLGRVSRGASGLEALSSEGSQVVAKAVFGIMIWRVADVKSEVEFGELRKAIAAAESGLKTSGKVFGAPLTFSARRPVKARAERLYPGQFTSDTVCQLKGSMV